MRTYPVDSPEAATRIVALACVADGHVNLREIDAMDDPSSHRALGLESHEMQRVLRELCEDVTSAQAHWSDSVLVDEDALAAMLDEIRSPALREQVLRLCGSVVAADGHVSPGETLVLGHALARWGLEGRALLPGIAARRAGELAITLRARDADPAPRPLQG